MKIFDYFYILDKLCTILIIVDLHFVSLRVSFWDLWSCKFRCSMPKFKPSSILDSPFQLNCSRIYDLPENFFSVEHKVKGQKSLFTLYPVRSNNHCQNTFMFSKCQVLALRLLRDQWPPNNSLQELYSGAQCLLIF